MSDVERELAEKLDLDLEIGPMSTTFRRLGSSGMAVLGAAWDVRRAELIAASPPGTRPWAFWCFDQGRDAPRVGIDEVLALLELRELAADEVESLLRAADELVAAQGPFADGSVPPSVRTARALVDALGDAAA